MKCKTVQNIDADVGCFPGYVSVMASGKRYIPSGTIICRDEFPPADCVALVQNGLADPCDDECRTACNRTPQQIEAAKEAMARLLSGGKEMLDDEDIDDDDSETDDDEEMTDE